MSGRKRTTMKWRILAVAALVGAISLAGCRGPSQANIALRKENQQLRKQIEDLNRQHEADQKTIAALESNHPTPRQLAESEIQKLFTTHGFKLGKLTGSVEYGQMGEFRSPVALVYLTPIDGAGDQLKAAGGIKVEVFDLDANGKKLGVADLDAAATRQLWNGSGILYCYRIPIWLSGMPSGKSLSMKITFTDQLTGRTYTQEGSWPVRLYDGGTGSSPSAEQPADTQPAK